MKCDRIRELIAEYIDDDPQMLQNGQVKNHLSGCAACKAYQESLKKTWDFLGNAEEITPQPAYISRFWTELSLRAPWHEKMLNSWKKAVKAKKLAPVYASVLALLIVGAFSVRNYFQAQSSSAFLAGLNEEDIEIVENMELAENLDIISDLDLLEDLEVIENFDAAISQQT